MGLPGENANGQHGLLKFTYECNNHSTKFRDLEIYKGKCFEKTNILDLKCFTKNTRYLDYFLLPLVKTQPSYISDTGDLIRSVENCTFDNSVLLVTYDITSLYTNLGEFSRIVCIQVKRLPPLMLQ
jgi:hypothetical protein